MTNHAPDAAPATKPKQKRAWLTLAAIAVAAAALLTWAALRGTSPAQTLQRADATDGHGHDLTEYQHRLDDLKPKCDTTTDNIARYTQNTENMLTRGGIASTDRLALLVYLDQTITPGQTGTCTELLGIYAAGQGVAP